MTHHDPQTQDNPSQTPHARAADAVAEGRPVEAQYVRQGRKGVRILWLLIISAGAAAVILLGMWLVSQGGFARTNANIGHQPVDAAAFQEGAGQEASGQPASNPAPVGSVAEQSARPEAAGTPAGTGG